MKKRILLIALIGLSFVLNAQDETVNGDLKVNGSIEAGPRSTAGGIILAQKYSSDDYIGTISSNYSSGNIILGYGAAGMPSQGRSGQLVSTFDNFNGYRSALRIGAGTFEFLSSTSKLQTAVGQEISIVSRLFVNKYGKVGIGTTNPGSWELAVNGKIRAKEIKVETGWSDFVFENNYKLPTLREVEKHIKEKGHLKDIPSANEVKKNGIFLGEMDSKLLQKIEELTLYTIQQEKEIVDLNKLKSKVQTLEKENESLKFLATKFLELQKRMEKLEKE
jgi:hypothetical protein